MQAPSEWDTFARYAIPPMALRRDKPTSKTALLRYFRIDEVERLFGSYRDNFALVTIGRRRSGSRCNPGALGAPRCYRQITDLHHANDSNDFDFRLRLRSANEIALRHLCIRGWAGIIVVDGRLSGAGL